MASWIEHQPENQRVPSWIPSQAHAWVAGQVPSRGPVRGNHTLMFTSFSLPSPLKINEILKKKNILKRIKSYYLQQHEWTYTVLW